jgi:16S rRNA (guanine527-N7)-methyltransferase
MSETTGIAGLRLNALLLDAGQPGLEDGLGALFAEYLALLVRWNARVNLTAIRDEEGILSRHFVESIACARALPATIRTLLDFGSGGGFPGIPIALCRPEIAVTLAESQGKKAAFLQEAVRVLGLSTKVHSQRAELLPTQFDCVTLRAVDRMHEAVSAASQLVAEGGWLAPMTTTSELAGVKLAAGENFTWSTPIGLPGSDDRILALGQKKISLPA